ncbi:MAG: sigma-70 family RNA polymerase sigma factor [Phycisphaerae bacterium]
MSLSAQQQRLVQDHLGLIRLHLARHIRLPRQPSRTGEYDDLFQEGCLALIEAARTYRPARHGPFAAYALPRIRYAISHYLYEGFATVRIPATVRKLARRAGSLPTLGPLPDPQYLPPSHASARHRPDAPTVGDLWLERYRRAVVAVASALKASPRCRPDRARLIDRFVAERLLIPEPTARTPKRQLARQFGCSLGRINGLERQFMRAIAARLHDDPDAAALQRRAASSDRGWCEPTAAPLDNPPGEMDAASFVSAVKALPYQHQARIALAALRRAGLDVMRIVAACYRRLDHAGQQDLRQMLAAAS